MRRSRHKLEVSTFPFLAVLLCAMGSLIFLLMVMDRRAKIVARHKLEAKWQQEAEEQETAREAAKEKQLANRPRVVVDRQAEWEREREKLHKMLVEQERELRSQLAGMTREIDSAAKNAEQRQAYVEAVKGYLTKENARLLREYQDLARKKNEAGLHDQQGQTAKGDLQRLTLELLRMEKTLKDLKDLKTRPSDTFSLIPYRGKFGDTRRPVYVECSAGGLTVHPNRTFLSDYSLTSERFRQEVEQRAGTLEFQKKPDPNMRGLPPTNPNAYVLFLVRPDGIMMYLQAQHALERYAIDYGYELVEPSWVFDFSNEDIVAQQPWQKEGNGPGKNRPVQGGSWTSLSPSSVALTPPPGFTQGGAGGGLTGPTQLVGPPGSGLTGAPVGAWPGSSGSEIGGPPGNGTSARPGGGTGVRGYAAPGTAGIGGPSGSGFSGPPGSAELVGPPGAANVGSGIQQRPGFAAAQPGTPATSATQNGGLSSPPGNLATSVTPNGGSGFGASGPMPGKGYPVVPPPPTYIFPAWMLNMPSASAPTGTGNGMGFSGYSPPNAGIMASIMPSIGGLGSTAQPSGTPNAGLLSSMLPPSLAPGLANPNGIGGLWSASYGGVGGSGIAGNGPDGLQGNTPFGYPANGGSGSGKPGTGAAASANSAPGYSTSGNQGTGTPGPGTSSGTSDSGQRSFRVNPAYAQAGSGSQANSPQSDVSNPAPQGYPNQPGQGTLPGGANATGPSATGSWQSGGASPGNGGGGPGQAAGSGANGGGGSSGAGAPPSSASATGGDPGALPSTNQRPPSGNAPPGKTPPGQYGPVNAGQEPPSLLSGTSSTDVGPRTKPAPTLTQLRANHDYNINLVCWPDGVVLSSTNEFYAMNPVENQKAMATSLVQTIQQMVARRQAAVRDGEPPYQPMIRLQLQAEGVRSFIWIVPSLRTLNIPMTRENLIN
jgi:hypothetical protein